MKNLFVSFLFCLVFILKVQSQVFTDINANIENAIHGDADWGDYDNDGDLDLLICGVSFVKSIQFTKIYRNDSNGVFTDINITLPGVSWGATATWFDFNNDNYLDFMISGSDTSGLKIAKIYQNNMNGSFTDINANLKGVTFGSTDFGDFDNDGDIDILLTGHGDSTFSNNSDNISIIYRNDNGVFTNINANLVGIGTGAGKWGDFDGDSDLDVLLLGQHYTDLIYRNDGGVFTRMNIDLVDAGYDGFAADCGDYDSDGDLDIVISGNLRNSGVEAFTKILSKDYGSLSYRDITSNFSSLQDGNLSWGDCDNDGDLDILATGANADLNGSSSNVYRNEGNSLKKLLIYQASYLEQGYLEITIMMEI